MSVVKYPSTSRSGNRHWPLVVVLALALAPFALPSTTLAASFFNVTKTADTNDGACDGDCSLREAISAANVAGGSPTINVPAGTFQLTRANAGGDNEDDNATGDLDVNASVTILGAGSGSTIIEAGTNNTNGIDKVFALNPYCTLGLNVTMNGVAVRFGRNTQPTSDPNYSFTGGGIDWCAGAPGGTFSLINSVVSDNTNVNGYGGGLNVDTVSAPTTVNITNVEFLNNRTLSATNTATGGAINLFGDTPSVNITNSTFSGNSTGGSTSGGGAIYFRPTTRGSLTISGSTFSNNTAAGVGGAIATDAHGDLSSVTISSSTFTGNRATNSFGGALDLDGTIITSTPFSLSNLTITGNTAGQYGGGIYVGNADVTISKSIIAGNSAPVGSGMYKNIDPALATATGNWWGCSTGPSAPPCDTTGQVSGGLNASGWYSDVLSASTSPIVTNQSTWLTANFGPDLPVIVGRPVTWAATLGTLSAAQGSIQATGMASGLFQATSAGPAIISAKVDNDKTSPVSPNVLSLAVNQASTTTTIANGAGLGSATSVTGEPVVVNFDVTGAFGNSPTAPTGNVTVSDGTNSCTGTVAAGTCSVTFTTPGAKTLTATYASDANFGGSTSSSVGTTVIKANTTASITSDAPDPSIVGQAVTVQYGVAVTAPGSGTPTGDVTVSDGTVSCTGTVAAGQCALTFTSAGTKSLTATYAGDSKYEAGASTSQAHQANPADTTTTITSDSPDPSNGGQAFSVNFAVAAVGPGAGTPAGNVTVSDGVDSCTGAVAAGTCTITLTTPGNRSLTATYAGDANFNGSSSAAEPHSVILAATTTTIAGDAPYPSVVGQSVTVRYSVGTASGTPTGNVTVGDGTISCTGTVAAGECSLTFTTPGAKTLTATYSGDVNFAGSTSASEAHQVNAADTTTSITSDSPDPSVVGQSVTVQYGITVDSPGAGTPTGDVTVSDGTISCTGTVAAGQCALTFTSPGARSLTATYPGDVNFNGSTSATEAHQVNAADTATTITSDTPDPSVVGQAVTVLYSVAPTSLGAGTPTGNVTVSDGVDSCTGTVSAGTCAIALTTSGSRSLTATYAGDSNFTGSSSAGEPHSVVLAATTTTITFDSPDPSIVGQPVTVQYSVGTASGTPTGNVTVGDGTISCTGTVAAGQCALTFTTPGAKTLTATYAGDSGFDSSTSAGESHQVNAADTTTTITSHSPDPSVVGQSVAAHYSVTVDSPGAGTPTGNVTVSDGTVSCTGTVAAGQCSLTFTAPGAKSLTATYAGDANYNSSTSTTEAHQANLANTTTSITSDGPDPSATGAAVTVNFTVAPVAPGAGTPTGNVTVSDGVDSCTGSVAAGQCSFTFTTSGAKSLIATYAGDSNFYGSTSAGEAHQVTAATRFTVSTTSPVTAGTAAGVVVTAKDAFGNTATGYRGTVHFTSSDTKATLPANYTFTQGDAGTHTFSAALSPALVLKTAGGQWVRATDTITTSITGSQTVTVTAGVAKTVVVSNIPSPVTAGTAAGVVVTAKDAFGNTATGYRGTVHFTSSDTKATLPANYTFTQGDAGTHTFSAALSPALVLKTGGSQWVRATDTITTSITGSQTVTVTAGVAKTVVVSNIPSPVTAGTAAGVVVTAKDAFGNTATGYRGTVHFTSSDTKATLPANYTFTQGDAGSHTFSAALSPALVLKTAGGQWVRATDTITTSITGSQAVTVTAGTSGATYHPITPARLVDSRSGNGLSHHLVANTPATFQVAGRGGVPANATAVTGNITVVNATNGWALYIGPSPVSNPPTTTITFSAGQVLSSGLTANLGSGGSLSATYLSSAGSTTDLVFDVTGYFTNDMSGSTYHPITPARLVDSRSGNGLSHHLVANTPATFQVAGRGGVPANATAVTGNVTVVNATNGWALYIGPSPVSNPPTSTINFSAGQVRSNVLTVGIGSGGTLSATFLSSAGSTTDVVFDVTGYFTAGTSGATYHPITPARLVDSRSGNGLSHHLVANTPATFQVAGRGGVPANATAVTGNITVVNATNGWALYIGPSPVSNPPTTTITFSAGQVLSSGLTANLGSGGSLSATYLSSAGSTTDLVFDVTGYFQ